MKNQLLRIALIVFLFPIVCCSQNKPDKAYKVFRYKIDNNLPKSFGYLHYDDIDIGPKSMIIIKDHVYIADEYSADIKKINIHTGKLNVCQMLGKDKNNETKVQVFDLAYLNGRLFVPSSSRTKNGFFIDTNMNNIREIKLGLSDSKYIYNQTKRDGVFHLIEYSQVNKPPYKITAKFNLISNSGFVKDTTIIFGANEFNELNLKTSQFAKGKKHKTTKSGSNFTFKSDSGIVNLPKIIPSPEYYDCNNVDFDSRHLVYFDIRKGYLTLYVYKMRH